MKKIFVLIAMVFILQGCVSGLLNKIPEIECRKFKYVRQGNFTSAYIDAEHSRIKNGVLRIESLELQESTPWASFSVYIDGYRRKIK